MKAGFFFSFFEVKLKRCRIVNSDVGNLAIVMIQSSKRCTELSIGVT